MSEESGDRNKIGAEDSESSIEVRRREKLQKKANKCQVGECQNNYTKFCDGQLVFCCIHLYQGCGMKICDAHCDVQT